MKNKILFFAILLFAGSTAFSQSLHLGLKGGANFGKISGKAYTDEFKLGYHIGAYATIGITSKFGIQPEVMFSQTNADANTSNNLSNAYDFSNIKSAKFNSLIIPIMLNYKVNPFITLQAGPQFGVVIDKNKSLFKNSEDAFKSGEFALAGGIQLNLLKFKIYGRYVGGMTNLDNIGNEDSWKESTFQVGVGFNLF